MVRHRLAAVAALCLIGIALAASACGDKRTRDEAIQHYSQELRAAVSSNVVEEHRRDEMLAVIDKLEALHRRFSQETADFLQSYRTLNADYDATRSSFDRLFADYTAKRVAARSEALDLHFQLAALATADEWHAIGKAETRLYEEVNTARPAEDAR
jgi:hypothetical protein